MSSTFGDHHQLHIGFRIPGAKKNRGPGPSVHRQRRAQGCGAYGGADLVRSNQKSWTKTGKILETKGKNWQKP